MKLDLKPLKIAINPSYAVVYQTFEDVHRFDLKSVKNAPKGFLSAGAKRKMKLAIANLQLVSKEKRAYNPLYKSTYTWRLNMITLTLPAMQKISDSEFKRRFLGQFFVELIKRYKPSGYVYRLEPQANGNIHAHIVSDVYIDKITLRKMWNRILSKGHFIDDFEAANGHRDPNSTDVHSLRHVNNVIAYLTKYLSKNDTERRKLQGKLWGCSDNLLVQIRAIFSPELDEKLTEYVQSGRVKFWRPKDCPYISFFLFDEGAWPPEITVYFQEQFWRYHAILTKSPTIQEAQKHFNFATLILVSDGN